jgi:hypothetical protein
MLISDCYVIKLHVSHVWYGCWTIKALEEAEMLCDGFSASHGGIAAPPIIARPSWRLIFINIIRLAKNLFLTTKMLSWHWLCIISSVASKRAIHQAIGKKPLLGKKCLICLWCLPVHHSYWYCITLHFICWGTRHQFILHEANWTKTGGCYGKARLKGVLHAPPCINSGQHMCSCVVTCSTWLWETHGLSTNNTF